MQNIFNNISRENMKSKFWQRKKMEIGFRVNLIIFLLVAILIFSTIIQPEAQILSSLTTTTVSAGSPRPDEVDLTGTNIWKTDSDVPPHNNLGFRITKNALLIIYPGVTVEFDSGRQLLVEGTLRIIGSPSNPVNLTTKLVSPTGPDWAGINFVAGSKGYVNHSNITYCASGVRLEGTTNIKIANSTINDVDFGIKVESDCNNIIIENNEIFNSDTGIGIYSSNYNTICNNTIYNSSVSSLSIGSNSRENNIELNEMFNGSNRGISISGKANNNTVSFNHIYLHDENGIRCTNTNDNSFKNNQIHTNGRNGILLYFGSDGNSFMYNTITQNGYDGLRLEGIEASEVILNDISHNGNGVIVEDSRDIYLENNTIISSTTNDFSLSLDSIVTSVNNTFNSSKVAVYDSSELHVYWYMFLETQDKSGLIIPAIVNITNATKEIIVPETSINGNLDWIMCLGYIHTGWGHDKSMNPYWVRADNGTRVIKVGFDMSKKPKECIVKFLDYPPPEGHLPDSFKFSEDTTLELNLSNYFTSSENLEYRMELISKMNMDYLIDPETSILTATPPPNWNGEDKIRVFASANLGGEISEETTLTVEPINDPPYINQSLPSYIKTEGDPGWELNLSKCAYDEDLIYGDILSWYVTDVNDTLLNLTVINNSQVLHFELASPDVFGSDNLMIWVQDLEGEVDFRQIWVNVTVVYDEPMLTNMKVFPNSGTPVTNFNFSVTYIDFDGDFPSYVTVKLDNTNSYEMVQVDKTDQNVMDGKEYYYKTTLKGGEHYFWFECSDERGDYNRTPRQNGPIVTMPDKGSIKGSVIDSETNQSISNANVTIISLENTSLQYTKSTDDEGNYALINLEPGKYQIYATAEGYIDSNIFQRTLIKGGVILLDITLEPLPPDVIDTIITQVWIEANRTNITEFEAIDFIAHAIDLDGDILTYIWDFADGTDIVHGKQVSHSFYKNGTYNVSLTVYDTDGNELTVQKTINVTPRESPYPSPVDGDGKTDTEDDKATNFLPIIFIIILIIVIIALILFFMNIRQKRLEEEEEQRRLDEEQEHRRKVEERRRRKRERQLEFVDREKRNVEQVNLVLAQMRRDKAKEKRGRHRK